MTWDVTIFGFETEEEAENARVECQIKYAKWAAKMNESEGEEKRR